MTAFTDIFLGSSPDDDTGTEGRSGGQIINDNFAITANKTEENTFTEDNTFNKNVVITGNSNAQGLSQNIKFCKQYPVVSLGTKLIIPFISQGVLNSTTIVRIIGHSAKNNSNIPLGFTIDFNLGHLTTLTNFAVLNSSGNYASAAINGMNIEITFTSDYTSATADGIFVTIEYMTNNAGNSIDTDNIVMN